MSGYRASVLVTQWGSTITSPWVTNRCPSWYDLRCCQDLKLPSSYQQYMSGSRAGLGLVCTTLVATHSFQIGVVSGCWCLYKVMCLWRLPTSTPTPLPLSTLSSVYGHVVTCCVATTVELVNTIRSPVEMLALQERSLATIALLLQALFPAVFMGKYLYM